MKSKLILSIFFSCLIGYGSICQSLTQRIDSLNYSEYTDTLNFDLGSMRIAYKKAIKELKNFTFHSGSVWFAGYGFPYVVQADPKNNSSHFEAQLNRCKPGTSIILAYCVIKKGEKFSKQFSQSIILK